MALEILTSISRAGADLIITYQPGGGPMAAQVIGDCYRIAR